MPTTDDLLGFVHEMTPTFQRPDHLRPVAELLARVAQGEPVRALVSVPPRSGKTETVVIHGVPWLLAIHPDWHVAYATYEANLARAKSARARDVAAMAGLMFREDSQSKSHWLTPEDGGLFATGIGGPLTGHGFRCVIVDDATKNRAEAESPTIRENIHQWFTSTVLTRIEPGGSVIVMHTRWTDDDLIGRLSRDTDTRWEVVNLPAILHEGSDHEAALWPARWPLAALDARRREVGTYDWASLYQGQPRPRGGRLFGEPGRYDLPDLDGARIIIICDPAATEKSTADYSAIVVLAARGYGPRMVVYVLDVLRRQVAIPKLVAELARVQRHWEAPLGIEATGGFKAVPQMLRAIDPSLRIFEIAALGDKFTRALPCAAAWNDGRVLVPKQAPWLKAFLDELTTFTGVKDLHDDCVDALAHGFNVLVGGIPAPDRGAAPAPGIAFS